MTDRKKNFINEFNALLKKFKVEITAREECRGYECYADGIDFDFEWEVGGDNPETIECGTFVNEIETEV